MQFGVFCKIPFYLLFLTTGSMSCFIYVKQSLYPYVMSKRKFPVGHPNIHVGDFHPLDTVHLRYRGLYKCTVLPPDDLYMPVLPVRTASKKLMFPLCRTCAAAEQQEPCKHNPEERQLSGTWTHVELLKAVEKGYKIVSVDEVWEWSEWSSELFSGYMNTFFKIKEEASGYPAWCKTEADKAQHVEQVFQTDGVRLNSRKIEKNPGLRQVVIDFYMLHLK